MRLFSALILTIFVSPFAHADWKAIMDPLLKAGITKIGEFDVQEFYDKAGALKLGQFKVAPPTVISGSRQSGYYLCGKKPSANIASELPSEASASADQLELHELLGALCYDDSNYALSTALVILARMNQGPEKNSLMQGFGHAVFGKGIRLAGGTVVSGGGDIEALYMKSQVLELIMGDAQNAKAATNKFLIAYTGIAFEPLRSNVRQVVYLQYDFKVKRRESLSVFIPMQRLKQSEAARRELVQETARKIREVFPSYAGQASAPVRPSACGANAPTINFPVTQDKAVQGIQDVRAGLILGCAHYGTGFTGETVTAPYLATPSEPRQSGYYYFNCTFTYGQAKETNRVKVMAGRGQTSSIDYPANGITMRAWLSVDANGALEWTAVSYNDGGTFKMTPKTKGNTQGTIGGYPASYGCTRER